MSGAAMPVAAARVRAPAAQRSSRALWIAGAAAMLLAVTVQPFRGDSDVWWHLALGRLIVSHGIPTHEPFSFLTAGNGWTDQAWLYEVILYRLVSWGGDGLASLFMGVVAVSALCLAALSVPRSARVSGLAIAAAMVLSGLVMGQVVGVRSQVFTVLGVAAVLYIVTRWREGNVGAVWALPPVFLLWANLHAGFVAGFALVLIAYFFASPPNPGVALHRRPLLLALLASALATMLNPAGPALYGYVAATFLNPTLTSAITEWLSPDFHNLWLRLFEVEAVLMVLCWTLGGGPRVFDLVLGGVAVAATLQAQRNVSLFAVIAVPQLATYGSLTWRTHVAPRLQRNGIAPPRAVRPAVGAAAVAAVAIATAFSAVIPNTSASSVAYAESTQYPEAAVDYVGAHLVGARLYSPDVWGGYIAERFPQSRAVFLYGETAVFGDAALQRYEDIHLVRPDWMSVLATYEIHDAVVPLHSQEASALSVIGWNVDCYDAASGAVVMSATAPAGATRTPVLLDAPSYAAPCAG